MLRMIEVKPSLIVDTVCILLREANRQRTMAGPSLSQNNPVMAYVEKLEKYAQAWSKYLGYQLREDIWDDYRQRNGFYEGV